jgi:hypothetical protein
MSLTRTTTSETGPFYASGSISFSSLRTNFKRTSSGNIKASELRRDTDVTETEPIVPDCTENRSSGPLNNGISTSNNLKISQFRNSIKYYDLDQGSDTDLNLNIALASLWNSNLQYNIEKRVYLSGTSGSSTTNTPAASLDATTVYNVLLLITGSILGDGGSAGTETTDGGDGGDALYIDTNSTGTVTVRTSGASAQVYGGGGGGGGGGDGGTGGQGKQDYSYTVQNGTGYSRGGNGGCGCPGGQYCGGSQGNGDPCCGGALGTPGECFCCFYDTQVTGTNYFNGGGGGDGADGGVGQGYLQARTFGGTGVNGGPGGTNAGSGGQGGDGGDGGTYGQDGEDGETGDTGANGNHTGGSAGASGTSGGTAGRAVAGSGYTIDTANGVDSAYLGLK